MKGRYRRSTRQPQGVVSAVAVLLKRCGAVRCVRCIYEFCQRLGKRYVVVEGGWVVGRLVGWGGLNERGA